MLLFFIWFLVTEFNFNIRIFCLFVYIFVRYICWWYLFLKKYLGISASHSFFKDSFYIHRIHSRHNCIFYILSTLEMSFNWCAASVISVLNSVLNLTQGTCALWFILSFVFKFLCLWTAWVFFFSCHAFLGQESGVSYPFSRNVVLVFYLHTLHSGLLFLSFLCLGQE